MQHQLCNSGSREPSNLAGLKGLGQGLQLGLMELMCVGSKLVPAVQAVSEPRGALDWHCWLPSSTELLLSHCTWTGTLVRLLIKI